MFYKFILVLGSFVFLILFISINLSTPPALSAQIDLKTLNPIKLNSYVDNYRSNNGPSWSSWWMIGWWWK